MVKKVTVFLLALALSLSFSFNANAYTSSNWMGSINGQKSLAELSIPGTHDSGSLYETVVNTAKCQSLTITEQLNIGVRYLDIRCRHVNDRFDIQHGIVYQKANFDDVINACTSFLATNPTETIIMSVKEEYNASGTTRTFEQTFDYYTAKNPSLWLLTDTIPTLAQARGKIVLLRRFSASSTPKGISATNWSDNTTFTITNTSSTLRIQDQYVVPNNDTKWNNIASLLNEANTTNPSWLFINYTSGYKSIIGIPNIPTVSNNINPRVKNFFTTNISGRYGIVTMDFIDYNAASLIIATNFN